MNNVNHFSARDFNASTVRALNKRGVTIIGITHIPRPGEMGYANGTRGYELSDNGCFCIRTHAEVRAMVGK
jgi:hypothetical protein